MKTEKEIREKILQLREDIDDNVNNNKCAEANVLLRQRLALKWVLGER